MYIKSISLKNWRSYRTARFDFPQPRPNKKVVLVGAMNGHGKTSVLMALHLGLFGRAAMQFVEGYRFEGNENIRSYKQLLARMLHRPAINESDPTATVDLVFGNEEGETISVTRTWHFKPGGQVRDVDDGDGEEVVIMVGDRPLRHSTWQQANDLIASKIVSLHVLPCFFFDGEQAQARVEATGNEAMYEAVDAIFGTGAVRELDESLATYANNQWANLKRSAGEEVEETELDAKRAQHQQLEAQLKTITARREELARLLADAERTRTAKLSELEHLGEDRVVDLDQLAKRKTALQSEELQLRSRLTDALAACALPLAMRRLSATVQRQLVGEIARDKHEVLKQEAGSKVDQIVSKVLPKPGDIDFVPELNDGQKGALDARLRSALTALWEPAPADCASEYRFVFLSSSERSSTLNALRSAGSSAASEMSALASQWHTVQLRLKEIKKQWEANSDLRPRTEQLRKDYDEADARYQTLANERLTLEHDAKGLDAKIADLSATIGQMEKRQTQREPAEQKLELVKRVRAVCQDTQSLLLPLCREAIAEACSQHFSEMISDEYRRFTVHFDEMKQPFLRGPNGETVPVGAMSGAQKRAFGLAFTLAIAAASRTEFPIVIDTPVGNMDSEYRTRVLRYLAKTAPGQLIFLSHNEEISRQYAKELDYYVAERYLVEFTPRDDGAGTSRVFSNRYFANA